MISDESNAETLIRLLSEHDTMSCVLCTRRCDESTKLVRARRKRKRKVNKLLIDEKHNLESEHQRFVKDVVLGLSIGNGEFLIRTMWID